MFSTYRSARKWSAGMMLVLLLIVAEELTRNKNKIIRDEENASSFYVEPV